MRLTEKELNDIKMLIDTFQVSMFELHQDNSSGIGYTLQISFDYELCNKKVVVTVPVTGVENW